MKLCYGYDIREIYKSQRKHYTGIHKHEDNVEQEEKSFDFEFCVCFYHIIEFSKLWTLTEGRTEIRKGSEEMWLLKSCSTILINYKPEVLLRNNTDVQKNFPKMKTIEKKSR